MDIWYYTPKGELFKSLHTEDSIVRSYLLSMYICFFWDGDEE